MESALLLVQGVIRLWADVRVVMGLPVPDEVFGKPGAPETDHTPEPSKEMQQ